MKTHGRLSGVLRPVVLTCCAGALLALPALAGAAPTDNQGSKPHKVEITASVTTEVEPA